VKVEIVEDDDAARTQGQGELRLDLDREGLAVRRSFDDSWRYKAVASAGCARSRM
jgi:hypothetical protein